MRELNHNRTLQVIMIRRATIFLVTIWAVLVAGLTAPCLALAEEPEHMLFLPVSLRNVPGQVAAADWVSPFGIDMYGAVNDAAGLAAMKEAGASWVVTMMGWAGIQPSPEGDPATWNWDAYDAKFSNAKDAGMDVGVLVTGVPTWAQGSEYPYSGGGPGMDVEAFAAFLAAAAERYDGDGLDDAPGSPVVKYWTLFAEPDYCGVVQDGKCTPRVPGESFKGMWGKSGAEYARMMEEIYAAIKGAAPDAVVTNGGLAFDYFTDTTYPTEGNPERKGIYERQFMADIISAGGHDYMDMLAVHYYPVTMASWTDKLRELYETAYNSAEMTHMQSLPLISPEMGYWSWPQDDTGEREQAIRLVQMFTRGLANGVRRMAWFAVFDGSPEYETEQHGLFRGDDLDQPKQSYWAYKTMAFELYGFDYEDLAYSEDSDSPVAWRYEAYMFRRGADGARKLVAWANPRPDVAEPIGVISVEADRVMVVSMLGINPASPRVPEWREISDGGPNDLDGIVNGEIALTLGRDPVYISLR